MFYTMKFIILNKMRKFDVLHDVNLMSPLYHSTTTPVSMINHSTNTPVRVGRCRWHILKYDFLSKCTRVVGDHPPPLHESSSSSSSTTTTITTTTTTTTIAYYY